MKFLIAGGTGFIGQPLCKARLALGDAVTVLTRDVAHAQTVLPGEIHFIHSLAKHQDSFDVIINLADPTGSANYYRARRKTGGCLDNGVHLKAGI